MKFLQKKLSSHRKHVRVLLFGIRVFSDKAKNTAENVVGNGNVVQLPKNSMITVYIRGNNNRVIVEETTHNPGFAITLFAGTEPVNNCTVHIGKNFSVGSGEIRICEDNTIVEIGDDCMFSDDIKLFASDTHTILRDGKVSNIGKHIKIGNHVWLGHGATVLKNTTIPDNSIVGARSVVVGMIRENGSIIAGNPARVIRAGVNWDRRCPKQYMAQEDVSAN